MKVAIIGRSELLYNTALLLLKKGYIIPLVITAKESPEYSKNSRDFELLAKNVGAKFIFTNRINDNIESIRECEDIDIAVSVNYSSIISQKIINLFPLGILNAHSGDLPRYRGNACQAWAILNSEDKIGLCIHFMIGSELDSGDIIDREYLDINLNTKVTDCWNWMMNRVPSMFLNSLKKLKEDPTYVMEIQSKETKNILRCYPRIPDDARISWGDANDDILRLINASNKPYSGAFCYYGNKKLIIWDAEIYEDNEVYLAEFGQISKICIDGSIIVITGKGKLKINKIESNDFEGKPGVIIKSIRKRVV